MNNDIGEKYLPIGTVVMLKGGTKRAMITGFCSVAQDDLNKMYDYSGCIYPEGYISSNQVCLFDHEQIEKIYHTGLIDEEEMAFKTKLKTLVEQIPSDGSNLVNSAAENNNPLDETVTPDISVVPVESTDQPVADVPVAQPVDTFDQPVVDVPVAQPVDTFDQPVADVPVAQPVDTFDQPVVDVPVAPPIESIEQPVEFNGESLQMNDTNNGNI